MAGTSSASSPDVDFVEYARPRQHTLLRAAYLVCGDVYLAEELLQKALVQLARQWDRVREDRPDAYVRRVLYREAVSSWRRRQHEAPGLPLAGGQVADPVADPGGGDPGRTPWGEGLWDANPWDAEEAERRLEVLQALDSLTPRQRATIVLRYFEDRGERDTAEILGCSVGTVRSETHVALGRLRAAMPRVDLEPGGAR